MVPIKEALTFDDVTLVPKYSEILPSEVDTSIKLTDTLKLKIPLLSSAMDTVTESKMAIAIAKSGGLGIIHRNLDIKKQVLEVRKVKKQKLLVGAAAPTSNFCFLTFLTSRTCFLISKFLWIIPSPPDFAIAIAILLSVTVSIADDKSGILSFNVSVNFILVSTSEGNISEYLGTKVTSSKVSASFIGTIIFYI